MHGSLVPVISGISEKDNSSKAAPVSKQLKPGQIACIKSNVAGKIYSNTNFFDDYYSLIKGSFKAAIYELRVIHDDDFVYGFQGFYQIDDKTVTGEPHFGREINTSCVNESIKLQYGECIIAISGNYHDVVNGIMITTSLGKTYAFGNYKSGGDTTQ